MVMFRMLFHHHPAVKKATMYLSQLDPGTRLEVRCRNWRQRPPQLMRFRLPERSALEGPTCHWKPADWSDAKQQKNSKDYPWRGGAIVLKHPKVIFVRDIERELQSTSTGAVKMFSFQHHQTMGSSPTTSSHFQQLCKVVPPRYFCVFKHPEIGNEQSK